MLTIVAANTSKFSQLRKNLDERRSIIEKARSARVKRIQQDVQRIAKREVEFSKTLMDDLVPFRLVWNEDAVKKAKQYVPFTIEEKEESTLTAHDEHTLGDDEVNDIF